MLILDPGYLALTLIMDAGCEAASKVTSPFESSLFSPSTIPLSILQQKL
jgi:hypothetical protein